MKKRESEAKLVYVDPDQGFGLVKTSHGNYIVDENQLKRAKLNKYVGVVDVLISYTLTLDSLPIISSKDNERPFKKSKSKFKSRKLNKEAA